MITNARSKRRTPRSKTGCIICRKRRVKCDEQRPTCSNCLNSSTPCTYAPPLPSVGSSGADQDHGSSVSRRGRGRPRKDWATIASAPRSAVGSGNNGSDEVSLSSPPGITALGSSEDNRVLTLNASDLDLLSHFVTHTGPSLGDPKNPNDHISYLWAHNVPQLGQRFPLVLHLAFALTARHMRYLGLNPSTRRSHEEVEGVDDAQELHTLSEFHFTRGLEALRDTLPHVNHDNCGALFVASKLLAFSILAAGPRSPDDLLVCSVGVTAETNPPALRSLWSPLGRDMRFIREAATDDVLFTGLLNSFRPGSDPKLAGPTRDCRPTWLVFGMHRVNWKGPINQLKELVISREAESRQDSNDDQSDKYAAVVGAFKRLERTYEATFGRDEDPTGDIEEPTDKVLIFWLYQLEDGFIESVQRKEPAAMLILAYYSVLFQNLQSRWYLEGWSEHLIRTIATLVAPEYMQMLIWPAKVVGIGNLSSEDR